MVTALTNIGFQIQHTTNLAKQVVDELEYLHKVNPQHAAIQQLNTRLTAVRDFARQLKNRIQQLHEKKAWALCDGINPHATGAPLYTMHVTGFEGLPLIEEEEEPPAKSIPTPVSDLAPKLQGAALAAHLKEFE